MRTDRQAIILSFWLHKGAAWRMGLPWFGRTRNSGVLCRDRVSLELAVLGRDAAEREKERGRSTLFQETILMCMWEIRVDYIGIDMLLGVLR